MDEIDLRDKYFDRKPEVYEAIIQNSRNMVCPVTRRSLWEDMEYVSVHVESSKQTVSRTRKLSCEEDIKKAKKQKLEIGNGKGKKRAAIDDAGGPDPKKPKLAKLVTDAQRAGLTKLVAQVTEASDKLKTEVHEVDANQEEAAFVPKAILSMAKAACIKADEFIAYAGLVGSEEFQAPEGFTFASVNLTPLVHSFFLFVGLGGGYNYVLKARTIMC